MKRWGAILGVAMSAVVATSAHAAEPRACTLEDCVRDALAHGPDLVGREAAIDAARAGKDALRGNYGPKLVVDGGVQVWDDELAADFDVGIPGIEIPPTIVREQVTWQVNVTLAQPLVGLWQIGEANTLAALGIDVAELEREATKVRRALDVSEAWLSAVLAEDLVRVAETSLGARESDRERAGALVKAGVIVESELLRAELGVTQAKQALAVAKRQVALARARLAQLVGVAVVPADGAGDAEPAPVATLEAAKEAALARRVELAQVRTRIAQAEAAVDLAWSKMAPDVNLVAQAQFARASAFGEEAAAFVGLTFNWTVWEWGAKAYGIDEARARVREAKAGLVQLEEGILLEVEAAHVEHASALDQAALAREAVKVAADHYDNVRKRFANKAATTFDLVEAETSLTRARADEKMARINGYLARARLARAMGMSAEQIAREGTP